MGIFLGIFYMNPTHIHTQAKSMYAIFPNIMITYKIHVLYVTTKQWL